MKLRHLADASVWLAFLIPSWCEAALVHRYTFSETNGSPTLTDSVGTAHGIVYGARAFTNGALTLPGLDTDYVDLPNGIVSSLTNISFEVWFTWQGASSRGRQWQRVFDLGGSTGGEGTGGPTAAGFLCLIPASGSETMEFIVGIGYYQPTILNAPLMVEGVEYHVACTYSPAANLAKLYVNGQLVASGPASIALNQITDFNNWIGRSNFGDPAINGAYREFRIYDHALSDGEAAANFAAGPDRFPQAPPPSIATGESLGPSTRRTGLVISEIMYQPPPRNDGRRLEFIELQNTQPTYENIGGFRLSGDVDYTIPNGTVLPGGGVLVIAKSASDLRAVYNVTNVIGGFTNDLPVAGAIRLRNRMDAVLLEANYSSLSPWPAAAAGAGHSLVLARPSFGERQVEAWAASAPIGGSPGRAETNATDALQPVVINEYLANPGAAQTAFIELYNHSTEPIDLTGAILTDDAATNKFRISNRTIAGPGFASFTAAELGFALRPGNQTIYLKNVGVTRVIDAVRLRGQERGVSTGRSPDGAASFIDLSIPTAGAGNSGPKIRDVVINEIMYHPISDDSDDEFVELHNRATNAVNIGGWRFSDEIEFVVPANVSIQPNGYVVVAKNALRLLTNYPGIGSPVLGNFKGKLSNSRGRIAVEMPGSILETNATNFAVTTNQFFIVMNEVEYRDGGRWSSWADGGGNSLELLDPHSDNRFAANWSYSDDNQKSAFTTIEFTGVLRDGDGMSPINGIEVILLGAGEAILDDVEVSRTPGVNLVPNPSFTAGMAGWRPEGNHDLSFWEPTGGVGGSGGLHIRAVGRGDYVGNRVQAELSTPLTAGETATIRGKVRWLRGSPEVALRLRGNYLEATGAMPLPRNLGTPGARNSRYVSNAPPAIYETTHRPALPAIGEAVRVTTRVSDPDGVNSVSLLYRVDPTVNYTSVPMADNGVPPDAIAGDGIYSASIPGQPTTNLVAFRIRAVDALGATGQYPNSPALYAADLVGPECLVQWGETMIPGAFGNYRFWITRASFNEWTTRTRVHNAPLDATFVYGTDRIIYNTGAKWAGSAFISQLYTTPTGELCGYNLIYPEDDPFLGVTDITIDWPARDGTAQLEQVAYWIGEQLGIPGNYRRFIHMFVNGVHRGVIYEDTEQPSGDYLEKWYPNDPDGDLYKMEVQWRNYTEPVIQAGYISCTMENFVLPDGSKNRARYRWVWLKRAVHGSANDCETLYDLIDAANDNGPNYTRSMEDAADTEEMMRALAFTHLVGNLDAYSYQAGHNMYAYRPEKGKWQFLPFDIDFVFQTGGAVTNDDLFNGFFNDPRAKVMVDTPQFRRAYWRFLQEAVNGPLLPANIDPVLDDKYHALISNGAPFVESPDVSSKPWLRGRRDFVISQLQSVQANFAITSNGGNGFSTAQNYVLLRGTAPVEIKTIRVNGIEYPVVWVNVNTWQMELALAPGNNVLTIQGYDRFGNFVPGSAGSIAINFTGTLVAPEEGLVINEIMYHPAAEDASFVEIFNRSTTTAFDLSDYSINGADFTFEHGTVLAPGRFAVVAEKPNAFRKSYGTGIPLAGNFAGKLDNGGETLSLLRRVGTNEFIVNQVKYDDDLPWPLEADGTGPSLQLIDPFQDNRRAGNWGVVTNDNTTGPQWKFVAVTGTGSSSRLYLYLNSAGDVFIDDIRIVAGPTPAVGSNYVRNGDFESQLSPPWTVSPNHAQTMIDSNVYYSGQASLHLIATSPGSSQNDSVWEDTEPLTPGGQYTLSYWYLPSVNGNGLTVRLSGSGIVSTHAIAPEVNETPRYTPGRVNATREVLPAFPRLWINEVQPNNVGSISDNAGDLDPWIEIYNASVNAVSLDGLFLTDQYSNLTQWAFPTGAMINGHGFKVIFADGETSESTASEFHTPFRLNMTNGSVALSRLYNGQPQVLDNFNYGPAIEGRSYGSFPDGNPIARREFYFVTPGGTNNAALPPGLIFINEWMADNVSTLADPADNDYEDWFELYNPGSTTVNLDGFYLTDTLTNRTLYRIPSGYLIPPGGFLLVWADGETTQNRSNRADLHVSFKLSAGGEAIGLFSPGGLLVDAVTFGAQSSDVSEGHFPDATGPIYSMQTPTPRAANRLPNSPPQLDPIGNKTVFEGQTLRFPVTASDSDSPSQVLTFSLDPGSPSGASIHPASGEFSWAPAPAQIPSSNIITIRVRDNGNPPLEDSETISILACPLPRITGIRRDGNQLTITWGTKPGSTYRVEYKNDLREAVWTQLDNMRATGASMTLTNAIADIPHRFYRVSQLD